MAGCKFENMPSVNHPVPSSRSGWTTAPDRRPSPSPKIQLRTESRTERTAYAGLYLLPGLLGATGLVVYLITLNHWVSPDSLGTVASLTGMIWGPEHLEPVTYLLTLPLRWLPAALIPAALNGFTAVCAALSLALLARTVSLLPHKIFKRNFKQCRNQPTLLRNRLAWLPPLLAVTVCGLQYTFWSDAIDATGGMINLLLFAYVVRCLPEYSVTGKDTWLLRGAFVYGLALANDWSMAAYFPAILISLFWVKRLRIFDVVFISRCLRNPRSFNLRLLALMPVCWLAGLSVFLLKPVLTFTAPSTHEHFWTILKTALRDHLASAPISFQFLFVGCLVTLIPVAYFTLRYYHNLTALKRLNFLLPRLFFHLFYVFFWLTCLWIMLDSPLSPRWLNLGQACLPLYYLAALSAGYFTGHFLRVAEASKTRAKPHRRGRARPRQLRTEAPDPYVYLKRGLVAFTGTVSLATVALLAGKNLPVILKMRTSPVNDFFTHIGQSLPAGGAVVICDDPFRQDYAEAAVVRRGEQSRFLFLNAPAAVQNSDYYEFLKQKNPAFRPDLAATGPLDPTNREAGFIKLIQNLAQTHAIYCLQPSPAFDYLAQYFYPQPAGLLYQLKPCPTGLSAIQPPPQPVTASETFWQSFEKQEYAGLARETHQPEAAVSSGLWRRMMNFHPELDLLTTIAGTYYASALNNRGVELQQRGHFAEAGDCFAQAHQLDPNNSAAQINQQFNQDYRNGKKTVIRPPQEEDISLTQYRDWKHVSRDGLVDEPNFCNLMGQILVNARLYRPAIAQLERAEKLAPGDLIIHQNLAVTYFDANDYAEAETKASEVIASEPANPTALLIKGISCVQLEAYAEAIPPLTTLLDRQPNNNEARLNRAVCYLKTGSFQAARRDYQLVTQTNPGAYSAYYNLAEMADQNEDIKSSIEYYELFLKYAPENQPQVTLAETRLKILKTMMP